MPVYEYLCPSCKTDFELLRPITRMTDEARCPECETPSNKKLSVFAPVVMSLEMLPMGGACDGGACGDMGGGCCGGACSF